MKRWLAGIGGVASIIIVGVVAYVWVVGFSMVMELLKGMPLYFGEPDHQVHVSYWMVLVVLAICPLAFTVLGVWLLRIAVRRRSPNQTLHATAAAPGT
jgi:hypothetical protein